MHANSSTPHSSRLQSRKDFVPFVWLPLPLCARILLFYFVFFFLLLRLLYSSSQSARLEHCHPKAKRCQIILMILDDLIFLGRHFVHLHTLVIVHTVCASSVLCVPHSVAPQALESIYYNWIVCANIYKISIWFFKWQLIGQLSFEKRANSQSVGWLLDNVWLLALLSVI